MGPEARALAQVLLDHHRAVCRSQDKRPSVNRALITYGHMCELAGLEELTRASGRFLQEVAEWCQAHGWPPLNALAVNKDSRMPGSGYDQAPGCDLLEWPGQVAACIAFDGYPDQVVD